MLTNAPYNVRGPVEVATDHELEPHKMMLKLQEIVAGLQREADRRVGAKRTIEQRWIDDYRQYHGKYDKSEEKNLKDSKGSYVYMNMTMPKTISMASRLFDILFPTDDRNYGILPTPVPELAKEASSWAKYASEMEAQALEMMESQAAQVGQGAQDQGQGQGSSLQGLPPSEQPQAQGGMASQPQQQQVPQEVTAAQDAAKQARQRSMELQAVLDEAKKRAKYMEDEIDDQLRECLYQAACRDVIHDACKLGSGIIKGPVVDARTRKYWNEVVDEEGNQGFELIEVSDPRPAFYWVDPWNFFPEMDARRIEESTSFFERHLMTKKDLRNLANKPGFDKEAIRKLLRQKPRGSSPQYINDLRSVTESYEFGSTDRFHVWEYHGSIEPDEMQCMMTRYGSEFMPGWEDDFDPLQEINVTIWFCQDEILKFGIHQLDSGEAIYSIFNLEKDDSSIFGFGVPYLIRDPQKVISAAWRMMLDNARYCTAPQIVYNRDVLEPEDGEWTLYGGKIWSRRIGGPQGVAAFETYNFNMHQVELSNIIELASRSIDQQSGIPLMAQGEPSVMPNQTAFTTSVLNNSMNVNFKRIIKNFDDDVTVPVIRRLYDWNMQFSDKEHIKGDFDIDARGTSVLVLREIQANNLMAFAMNFTAHPVLGPLIKVMPLLRRLVQSHLLPQDEIVKTDEQVAADLAAQAGQEEEDPKLTAVRERAAADLEIEKIRRETALQVAQMQSDTRMMMKAEDRNINIDKFQKDREVTDKKLASDERKFAAEAAVSRAIGPSGGGSF